MTGAADMTPRVRLAGFACLFFLFLLGWIPLAPVSTARAAAACPNTTAIQPGTATISGDSDAGTCTNGAVPTNGLYVDLDPTIVDEFYFRGREGGVYEFAATLSCPSPSTIVGPISVGFTAAGSCPLTATFDIGGTILTLTGTLSSNGAGALQATGLVATGGAFDAATGPSAQNYSSQDKAAMVAAMQRSFMLATPSVVDFLEFSSNSISTVSPIGGRAVVSPGLGVSPGGIDTENPFDRDYGPGFSPAFAPGGYFDAHRGGRAGFNFSMDLNRLAAATAERKGESGLGYAGAGDQPGTPAPRSRVDAFVTGKYVDFSGGRANAGQDGHLWVVTSGLGYRVSDRTTVGLLARYRSGEARMDSLGAALDTDVHGGGAYLTTTLGGGLNVALAGVYEVGSNDIDIAGDTGSFDSTHVTLEGRVSKRFELDRFWIDPGIGIRYIETDQDDYVDSSRTFIQNEDLTLGRLSYGPTIGTTFRRGDTEISPFAKINGVWDFENDGDFVSPAAGTFTSPDSAINLGGGLVVSYASGMALRLGGDWYGYDTDFESWSVSGGFGAPLSIMGLESVAFASLDFASDAEDTRGLARVRIPLGGSR